MQNNIILKHSLSSQDLNLDHDVKATVIYFDHLLAYLDENNLNLSCLLFSIFSPFFMKSEKTWNELNFLNHQLSDKINLKPRKQKNKTNFYLKSLTCLQLSLIEWAKSSWSSKIEFTKFDSFKSLNDNSVAIEKARVANFSFYSLLMVNNCMIYSNVKNDPILLTTKVFNYYIPGQCSFQCFDAYQSLKYFQENIFQSLKFHIDDKFLIIIDPPWFGNKSIKRKHCYKTQPEEEIIKVCQKLSEIIEMIQKFNSNCDIRIAIWSTEKQKSFVYEKMCPFLKTKPQLELLWHKITTSFESVKVRGSKEYLIICHNSLEPLRTGIFISVPSSIHSHKPPINHEMIWTNELEAIDPLLLTSLNKNFEIKKCQLEINKIPEKLKGLEIYARYLRKNFHSIGLECLKLQIENLFEKNFQTNFNS